MINLDKQNKAILALTAPLAASATLRLKAAKPKLSIQMLKKLIVMLVVERFLHWLEEIPHFHQYLCQ